MKRPGIVLALVTLAIVGAAIPAPAQTKEAATGDSIACSCSFPATPGKKSGLQRVRIATEVPNSEIAAADNVWVAAGK